MRKNLWYTIFHCETVSAQLPRLSHVLHNQVSPPFKHIPCRERTEEYFLIKLTLKGHGYFKENDKLTRLESGMFFFCRINDPAVEYFIGDETWEFIYACISGASFKALGDDLIKSYGHIYTDLPQLGMKDYLMSFRSKDNGELQTSYADNLGFVNRLIEILIKTQEARRESLSLAEEAKRLISSSSLQVLTVNYLADQLSVSREHLARQYKEKYGHSPVQEIHRVRLAKACKLLESTYLDIREVAFQCGIACESFSAWFRRQQNCSPGEFRRRNGSA